MVTRTSLLVKWFFVLLALSFFSRKLFYLKKLGFESIPGTVEILDERNYAHAGLTFRKTGIPTAWSNLYAYKDKSLPNNKTTSFDGNSILVDGQKPNFENISQFLYPITVTGDVDLGKGEEQVTFVQPFMDHPLFGSIIYSLGLDGEKYEQINPESYREISLHVSLLTGISIFFATYLISKSLLASFFAFFYYSISPFIILSSRYSLLENVIIPLSLLVLISVLLSKTSRPKYFWIYLVLAGLFSGLAFSTKEQGIFVFIGASLIYLFSHKVKFKKYLVFLISFLLSGLWSYIYYFIIGGRFYLDLILNQSERRFFGSLNVISTASGFHFNGFPLDGFWFFGLISLTICLYKKVSKEAGYFVGSFFAVMLFLTGENYSWYYLPLVPFLAIFSGMILKKLFDKPNVFLSTLFFILPFSSSFYWGFSTFRSAHAETLVYRVSLIAFLLTPFLITRIKTQGKIAKKTVWTVFIIVAFWQTYVWSFQGFEYIIGNWDKIPELLRFTLP
jgi:hypothetical protein